jgi:polygalacturonase
MNDRNDSGISRRQWVARASAPVIAATLASALLESRAAGAGADASSMAASDEKLLGARVYNIRDFGAAGDGKTLDTAAIQSAIDAANRDRGGIVLVPGGDFLVGSIELKSNVTLHLAAQGRLLGSGKREDYIAGKGIPPGNGNVVLLYAANAENVTIEGRGTIDGQGANFYTGQGDNTGPNQGANGPGNRDRPHLMVFFRCTNLLIRDVFLTRSAYHCCRILRCDHVRLDGVRIYNRVNKNNDGFHFNDSQYVNISNCNIVCQDDACALFGSNKFVTVTNCVFSTRWSVFRFGGGEPENIVVSNCVIYETYGCPIKISCGGRSRMQNMLFSNLVMQNVTGPISIGLRSRRRRATTEESATQPATAPARGVVRNIAFHNIRATVVTQPVNHADIPFDVRMYPGELRTCIVVNGVGDDVIENVSFTDVHVTFAGGATTEEAAVREVPQIAGEYFQIGTPPAYGIFARNVRGLTLDNVRLEVAQPDLRPAVVFDHVEDAAVTNLSAQGNPAAESVLRFIDARDVLLTAPRLLSAASAFLQVEGQRNQNVVVDGGQISKAGKAVTFARGAAEDAVKVRS